MIRRPIPSPFTPSLIVTTSLNQRLLSAGSRALRQHIEQARPALHLFGHLHEQRGVWFRDGPGPGPYLGGVEYQLVPGEEFPTWDPPPPEYPCQLISCNAMLNHSGMEGVQKRIAGPGRLIRAERNEDGEWHFSLPNAGAARL